MNHVLKAVLYIFVLNIKLLFTIIRGFLNNQHVFKLNDIRLKPISVREILKSINLATGS